jgi:hypothetical protein
MVITQSQGHRTIARTAAKEAIRAIIDDNPAIRSAVNTLVAHSEESSKAKKREKAILSVYDQNTAFSDAVDDALSEL